MFPVRRAALRFLSTHSTPTAGRSRHISFLTYPSLRLQTKSVSSQLQKRWASDEARKGDELPISQLQPTPQEEVENAISEDNAARTVESSTEVSSMTEPQDISEHNNPSRTSTENILEDSPADLSQDSMRGATTQGSSYGGASSIERAASRFARSSASSAAASGKDVPKQTVYVGNLFFDVTEDDLTKEMSRFGRIERLKIIRDARGLSKGFGYCTFSSIEEATNTVESLNQQLFEGRRLTVGYAAVDTPAGARNFTDRTHKPLNPPSKTLFIGNMSFEMTDRDLNNLFRGIKNVVDVRVAIDRRTGQPRGFAHADFTDTKSAMEAMQVLSDKETYGRKLRVDYSYGPSTAPRNQTRDAGAL